MLGILLASMIGSMDMKPLDYDFNYNQVEEVSTVQIEHIWFSSEDQRQAIIQRAYELWWIDFVTMIECENGNWDINARWDSSKSIWLCQMNTRWHKLPQEYYDSWEYQVEYCYQKWKWWTKFYGPQRIIKWQKCYNYVKSRFIINN